jgi:hypothetical protein
MIRQDPSARTPQKIGLHNSSDGWAGYANYDSIFVKKVPIQLEGVYHDMGANFEVFTNNEMLELETLGPLESIPPNGKIDLPEHWVLISDVPEPTSESDIDNNLLK